MRSADSSDGVGTSVGVETDSGVAVTDVGDDGVTVLGSSGMGESRGCSVVMGDPLGLRPEVSYDMSGPSGTAMDSTEGEACNIDDSYERSLSGAQRDSRMDGDGGVGCCKSSKDTVGVNSSTVGVIDDSVGLEIDSGVSLLGRDSMGCIGDGLGKDSMVDTVVGVKSSVGSS